LKDRKKKSKHSNLAKPAGGKYHRNEWSLIGAPCSIIDKLIDDISKILPSELKLGQLNADHKKGRKSNGFNVNIVDKISFSNISFTPTRPELPYRKMLESTDLVVINGNHFNGAKQIVLINEEKKESLSKKLDRLTDIRMILLQRSSDHIHDFIMELIKDKPDIEIFRMDQVAKICQSIMNDMEASTPPLYGLVLSGGKSQRMGEDKGAIKYHDSPQREHEANLIQDFCFRTFISCRKNQDELVETSFPKIYDSYLNLGPFGGILSAFREHPNSAWLTLACDLPYLDKATLKQLVKNRNTSKLATCFYNPITSFPEPLITIWEPRAYPVLLEYLSLGYSCPRKVLINSDIELIELEDSIHLTNVNDQESRQLAVLQIESLFRDKRKPSKI